MTWLAPRTWAPGEMVTAALMNQHVRDNLLVLSTKVDTVNGYPQPCLKSYGYSSGQGNVGAGDTAVTSYNTTIPAGTLAQQGDGVYLTGYAWLVGAAGTWTVKLSIDGGATKITIGTSTTNGTHYTFRLWLRRRTSSTTGSITGVGFMGAHQAVATTYLINSGTLGSYDWANATTLSWYVSHSSGTNGQTVLVEPRVVYHLGVLPGGAA